MVTSRISFLAELRGDLQRGTDITIRYLDGNGMVKKVQHEKVRIAPHLVFLEPPDGVPDRIPLLEVESIDIDEGDAALARYLKDAKTGQLRRIAT